MLSSAVVALVVTVALLVWMITRLPSWLPVDRPNARSLHERPVPRAGGLAILVGMCSGWLVVGVGGLSWIVPAVALAAVSWVDDLRGLPASIRLMTHFAGALGFLWAGIADAGWLAWLVATLAIVWMTNLFNFMDGSDGLAGGMALFGFGFYGLAAALAGDGAMAQACFAIAAAAGAFLWFNFHPARIFMGDAGSIPIGFLAAVLGLQGSRQGIWPTWFPVLVFSPFIVDASVTLMRRLLGGEKVWFAHRGHYYQRLVQSGFGHRNTALIEYVLMLAAGISATWGLGQDRSLQWRLLLGWGFGYLVLMGFADFYCKRASPGAGKGG